MKTTDFLLGLIFVVLFGILLTFLISSVVTVDNQRTAICLDHPTYHRCADWLK